jgi:hypothetical protein
MEADFSPGDHAVQQRPERGVGKLAGKRTSEQMSRR